MIFYNIPWSSDKNIGKAYNAFIELLPTENDYACFIDGDAVFTTAFFGKQIQEIAEAYPECGLFTAMTNRVGSKYQLAGEWKSNDMQEHRKIGAAICSNYSDTCIDISKQQPFSGVCILIRKSTWRKLGKFKEEGMLGVDTDIHLKAQAEGEKVYLMRGVYLQHWYRGGNANDKKHLE
jgi:GT2 family glycosyltransferase